MKKTQKDWVLEELAGGSRLTPLDAYLEYGIMRLAAVVHELREEGYPIITTMKPIPNRRGEICRVAEYSMGKLGMV